VTVRDFLLLSNPNECKKYALFMSNSIYDNFYKLKVMPTQDQRGQLLFRKIDDLMNPPSSKEKSYRQSLCLVLAYYYTRIFQIYGALALTLIDDLSFMSDTGILTHYSPENKLWTKGHVPYQVVGGAFTDINGYTFLVPFLMESRSDDVGYDTKYTGKDSKEGKVYFKTTSTNTNTNKLDAVFSFAYKGIYQYSRLTVSIQKELGTDDVRFEWKDLTYYKKSSEKKELKNISSIIPALKKVDIVKSTNSTKFIVKEGRSDISIIDYFTDKCGIVLDFIRRHTQEKDSNSNTVLKSKLSEVDTDEALRLGKIINNLQTTKPLAHCIGRALQLLRVQPIDGKSMSSICNINFFDRAGKSSRGGIPHPNDTLNKSPGLSALAMLFYDTIELGTPKVIMGKKQTLDQYRQFMQDMSILFGDKKDGKEASLSTIRNKRDAKLCEGVTNKTSDMEFSNTAYNKVQNIVRELFMIQHTHSVKCGEFFRLLFDIKRDSLTGHAIVALSQNVIHNGFPEIERINYHVREHLMKYYTVCESKYLMGMKEVLESRQSAAASAPAPSAPLTPKINPQIQDAANAKKADAKKILDIQKKTIENDKKRAINASKFFNLTTATLKATATPKATATFKATDNPKAPITFPPYAPLAMTKI